MLTTRRRLLDALAAALLTALMLGGGFALGAPPEGKGPNKDDGGGEEPAPLPPIEYQVEYFYSQTGAMTPQLMDMNDLGDCVGYDFMPDGEPYGWLYLHGAGTVVDLNDIGADGIPEGWWIRTAYALNDLGAIVGTVGDLETIRRYVLDTSLDPPMLSVSPVLDGMFPLRINENGDILSVSIADDGTRTLSLFNPGLYGPADEEPEVIPYPIANYNLLGDLNNPHGDRPAQVIARIDEGNGSTDSIPFRYTRGGQVELLDEVDGVKNDGFHAINDAGTMTGWTNVLLKAPPRSVSYVTRFDETSMEILPDSEGLGGGASGINNSGDLPISNNALSQFVYHDDWGLVDLWKVVSGSDVDLGLWTIATGHEFIGISDRDATSNFGMIAGWSIDPDGGRHFFVLTPRLLP